MKLNFPLKGDRVKPHILMVTHVIPFPPAAGNEIRIYKMLAWLHAHGYTITLVLRPLDNTEISNACISGMASLVQDFRIFDNRVIPRRIEFEDFCTLSPLDPDIQDLDLANIQEGFCPQGFVSDMRHLLDEIKPDAVIAQYVFMSRILNLPEIGDALKVIDTHDLFCRKQETVEQYGIKNYGLSLTEGQETALLRRADVVLAIQKIEEMELQQLLPDRTVLLTTCDEEVRLSSPDDLVKGQVLIVASSNEFNVRGTQDFIDYIWPLVREKAPHTRLRIIGRVCQFVQSDDPTISLLGFVENLDVEYAEAEVVVNPARVGTGLKIKTLEALARGKAHVAWPAAADGLRQLGDAPLVITKNVVEFANAIIHLQQNPEHRVALETKAYLFIKEHFASDHVYSPLAAAIDTRAGSTNRTGEL